MESDSLQAPQRSYISFVTNRFVPAYAALVSALLATGQAAVTDMREGLSRVTVQSQPETRGQPSGAAISTARAVLAASHLPLQWEAHSPTDAHTASFVAALTERLTGVRPTDTVHTGQLLQPLVNGAPVYVDRLVYAAIIDAVDIAAAPGHTAYGDPLATLALHEIDPALLATAVYALDLPQETPILLTAADAERMSANIDYLRSEGWWLAHMHVSVRPSCPRCKESREILSQWPHEVRSVGRATYFRFSPALAQFDVRMVPSERLWLEKARLDIAHGTLPLVRVTEFVGRAPIDFHLLQLASWLAYLRLLPRYPELLLVLADTEGGAALVHESLAISLRVASFEQLALFVLHVREMLPLLAAAGVESEHADTLEDVVEMREEESEWVAGKINSKYLLLRTQKDSIDIIRDKNEKIIIYDDNAADKLASLGFFEWMDPVYGVARLPGAHNLDVRSFPTSSLVMYGSNILVELSLEDGQKLLAKVRNLWQEGRLQDPWTLYLLRLDETVGYQPRISRLLLSLFAAVIERLDEQQSELLSIHMNDLQDMRYLQDDK